MKNFITKVFPFSLLLFSTFAFAIDDPTCKISIYDLDFFIEKTAPLLLNDMAHFAPIEYFTNIEPNLVDFFEDAKKTEVNRIVETALHKKGYYTRVVEKSTMDQVISEMKKASAAKLKQKYYKPKVEGLTDPSETLAFDFSYSVKTKRSKTGPVLKESVTIKISPNVIPETTEVFPIFDKTVSILTQPGTDAKNFAHLVTAAIDGIPPCRLKAGAAAESPSHDKDPAQEKASDSDSEESADHEKGSDPEDN